MCVALKNTCRYMAASGARGGGANIISQRTTTQQREEVGALRPPARACNLIFKSKRENAERVNFNTHFGLICWCIMLRLQSAHGALKKASRATKTFDIKLQRVRFPNRYRVSSLFLLSPRTLLKFTHRYTGDDFYL